MQKRCFWHLNETNTFDTLRRSFHLVPKAKSPFWDDVETYHPLSKIGCFFNEVKEKYHVVRKCDLPIWNKPRMLQMVSKWYLLPKTDWRVRTRRRSKGKSRQISLPIIMSSFILDLAAFLDLPLLIDLLNVLRKLWFC